MDDAVVCRVGCRTLDAVKVGDVQAAVHALHDAGCLPRPGDVTPQGDDLLIRWHHVGKLTYSWEWSVEAWRAAAVTGLRALDVLKAHRLTFSSLRPSDVFMAGTKPILTNFHALTPWSPRLDTANTEQLERHFVRPVQCALAARGDIARRLMKGGPQGVSARDAEAIIGRNGRPSDPRETVAWLKGVTVQGEGQPNTSETYEDKMNADAPEEVAAKMSVIHNVISRERPQSVLDLACNSGRYALLASAAGATVTGADQNEWCMNTFFTRAARHPGLACGVVMDVRDPSTTRGWGRGWCTSAEIRLPSECLFMMGFLHHLVLGMRLPTHEIRRLFEKLATRWALVEMVPPRPAGSSYSWGHPFFNVEWLLALLGDRFVQQETWRFGHRGRSLVLLKRA